MAQRRQPRLSTLGSQVEALRLERQGIVADLREVIGTAQATLTELDGGAPRARPQAKARATRKRHISPEARARIVAAVKRRWARYHAERKR